MNWTISLVKGMESERYGYSIPLSVFSILLLGLPRASFWGNSTYIYPPYIIPNSELSHSGLCLTTYCLYSRSNLLPDGGFSW